MRVEKCIQLQWGRRQESAGRIEDDDYFVLRPLPLPFLAAPVDVILLVCINSPIYLSHVSRAFNGIAVNIRLQESVAAFEFLMFTLDRFYFLDNLEKAGL